MRCRLPPLILAMGLLAGCGKQPADDQVAGAAELREPRVKVPVEQLRGVADDFFEPEDYEVLIVKAPAERVGQGLSELFQAREWRKNTGNAPAPETQQFVFLCQLRGHEWTIVMPGGQWSHLFPRGPLGLEHDLVSEHGARMLSEKVKARTIFAGTEDNSGAFYWQVYDSGRLVEDCECVDGEPRFKSSLRKVSKRKLQDEDFDETEFVNQLLNPDGAYLPVAVAMPCEDGRRGLVVHVWGVDEKDFARVDFLSFR